MIEKPAQFPKAKLNDVFAAQGKLNADEISFGDFLPDIPGLPDIPNPFAPGTIRFVKFRGALDIAIGQYVGTISFEIPGDDAELDDEDTPTDLAWLVSGQDATDIKDDDE